MIECNRTMEQARRDFALGRLSGAVILRVPMSHSAWTLRLSGAKGGAGMLLDVKTLETQVFHSLDGAAQALELIGFRFDQLTVDENGARRAQKQNRAASPIFPIAED